MRLQTAIIDCVFTYKEFLEGIPKEKILIDSSKNYTLRKSNLTAEIICIDERTITCIYDGCNIMEHSAPIFFQNLLLYNYKVVNVELLRDIIDSDLDLKRRL